MTDYIEREAAVHALAKIINNSDMPEEWNKGMSAAMSALYRVTAANVRPVVTCADCKWWSKQESSLQGRCELLQMYPTGAWFCANGKREES